MLVVNAKEKIPGVEMLVEIFLCAAVDHCLSSPCKNGATCTRHLDTYACKCPPGFHGSNCDKGKNLIDNLNLPECSWLLIIIDVINKDGFRLFLSAARLTSHGCRYRNGECDQFCREFPDRSHVCFCAPGYSLDHDNHTCVPTGWRCSTTDDKIFT